MKNGDYGRIFALSVALGGLFFASAYLSSTDSLRRMRLEYACVLRQRGLISSAYYALSSVWADVAQELHVIPQAVYELFAQDHPYSGIEAQVRVSDSDTIALAEKQAIALRLERVRECCAKHFGSFQVCGCVPRVALCCSGGGFRAMIATAGCIAGLADTGLLDCITYMAGLSGSTWCMAPWIASQRSIYTHCAVLEKAIAQGIQYVSDPEDLLCIVRKILEKRVYAQAVSAMDIYGPLLAHTLLRDLGPKHLNATLTQTHIRALTGEYPFPLYCAVSTNTNPYEWFEISPIEMGSSYLHAYVPTWSYGRRFHNGRSVNYAPEQTLGYFLGLFGSAFEVDLEDVIRLTVQGIEATALTGLPSVVVAYVKRALHVLVHELLGQVRLFPSLLPNITYAMDYDVRWRDERRLSLIDAGIDCNLPIAPLLRVSRGIDIMIVFDASTNVAGAPELRRAQSYAWQHNLRFPPIDFDVLSDAVIHIFKDVNDASCPVVIYVPLARNPAYSDYFDPATCIASGYCSTFNFTYMSGQVQELAGLMRYTIAQHSDLIWSEILACCA